MFFFFFFSSRRRHTRSLRDWSSDVCSSDLRHAGPYEACHRAARWASLTGTFGDGPGHGLALVPAVPGYGSLTGSRLPGRRIGPGRRGGGSWRYGVQVDGAVVEQFPVSGAQLYTETRGAGPLLLFVVGGNGDPAVFSGVAGRLAGDFTVVTYARRGFARSPVDGPVDDANRIFADVEDAVERSEERRVGKECRSRW